VHAGEEVGGVQAVVGDPVAVGAGGAGDQSAGFESAQVIGGLSGVTAPGGSARSSVVSVRRSRLVNPLVWWPNVSSA